MDLGLSAIHHVALICADYERSKFFYTKLLGFAVLNEHYRPDRGSYKLDLRQGSIQLELFSFPDPPSRPSEPEACGLRHIAFSVEHFDRTVRALELRGIELETVRIDEFTGCRFVFFSDPDGLPIEIYERAS